MVVVCICLSCSTFIAAVLLICNYFAAVVPHIYVMNYIHQQTLIPDDEYALSEWVSELVF